MKKQKFFTVFIGLLFILLLSEVFLFLAGHLYSPGANNRHFEKTPSPESISVICLGDSNTWGQGAPPGYSFPEQLKQMLDKKSENKFEVYNLGVLGASSSMILERLPAWVEKYEPDLAIIKTGLNDHWNWRRSNYHIFQSRTRRITYSILGTLQKLRTVRLLTLLHVNIRDKFSDPEDCSTFFPYSTPDSRSGQPGSPTPPYGKPYPEEDAHLLSEAENLILTGNMLEARRLLKETVKNHPDNAAVNAMLGSTFLPFDEEHDRAVKYFKKTLELDPENYEIGKELIRLYWKTGQQEEAEKLLDELLTRVPGEKDLQRIKNHGFFHSSDKQILTRLLTHNLEEMVRLLQERGVYVILQNYAAHHPNYIPTSIKRIRSKYDVGFVDNYSIFKRLEHPQDYFSSNKSHPNAKGYRVIAEEIFTKIIRRSD